jgi:hypothetical protein
MAYLTRVGAHGANVSGIEAKGYHVFRRGKRVRAVWGPIVYHRARSLSVRWSAATMYSDYYLPSTAEAVLLTLKIVATRIREGYSRLPMGTPISPTRNSSGNARRSTVKLSTHALYGKQR